MQADSPSRDSIRVVFPAPLRPTRYVTPSPKVMVWGLSTARLPKEIAGSEQYHRINEESSRMIQAHPVLR